MIRSLEAHYRTKLVLKYLTRIKLYHKLLNLSILDAMHSPVQAWITIANSEVDGNFNETQIGINRAKSWREGVTDVDKDAADAEEGEDVSPIKPNKAKKVEKL